MSLADRDQRAPGAIDWQEIRERLRAQQLVQDAPEDLSETFRLRAQELARAARTQQAAAIASHLHCTTGGIALLVPLVHVLRIMRAVVVVELPGAPSSLRHIMHVDGAIVAIADLRHVFGQGLPQTPPDAPSDSPQRIVLLANEKQRLALRVDRVVGLCALDEGKLGPASHTRAGSELVRGLGPRLELVLDVPRLINDLNVSGDHHHPQE